MRKHRSLPVSLHCAYTERKIAAMKTTAEYNSNIVTAGFDLAVGPAVSVPERQLNVGILPKRWADQIEVQPTTHCWHWQGVINEQGYGRAKFKGRAYQAHRLIYAYVFDDIDSGPVLDHRCHENDSDCGGGADCLHRRCVNPLHLVPTSVADNCRRGKRWPSVELRKTHCAQGHAFTEENTIKVAPSGRKCKTCLRIALRKWYVKKYGDYKSATSEAQANKLKKPINNGT
jgi:hypothetical protein